MNKLIPILVVFSLSFIITSMPVNAYWWNPWPKCSENPIIGCCNDDCSVGQRTCSQDMKYMLTCGTEYRIDKCGHYPTQAADAQYCPFGCSYPFGSSDAACAMDNPCAGGINGCLKEGDTRCVQGSLQCGTGKESSCVTVCQMNSYGCLSWGTVIEQCPYNCNGATCTSYNGTVNSQCSMLQTTCDDTGRYVIKCVRDNPLDANNDAWRWSRNAQDSGGWHDGTGWIDCGENGQCVKGNDGNGACVSNGVVQCECNYLEHRCDDQYPDYIQTCDGAKDSNGCYTWNYNWKYLWNGQIATDSSGVKLRDLTLQTKCGGKCHLGFCLAYSDNPSVYQCPDNCTIGDTRCGGDGGSYMTCTYDKYGNTGCNVWSSATDCPSGRCVNGECTSKFTGGTKIKMDWKNVTYTDVRSGYYTATGNSLTTDIWQDSDQYQRDTFWSDGQYLYVGAKTVGNISIFYPTRTYGGTEINYTVNKFTLDGVFVSQSAFNASDGEKYINAVSATYDSYDNFVYSYQQYWPDRVLRKWSSNLGTIQNWTGLPLLGVFGMAANENYLFVLNMSQSISAVKAGGTGKTGVLALWKNNMSIAYSFCLTANSTDCISNQTSLYWDKDSRLLYVLNEKKGLMYPYNGVTGSDSITSGSFKPPFEFELQVYGETGYYYGSYLLNKGVYYAGLTKVDGRFYFFTPQIFTLDNYFADYQNFEAREIGFLEIWDDISTRYNECVNGSSKCGGMWGKTKIPCVQDTFGSWKYMTSEDDCNAASKASGICQTANCPNGCDMAWANHIFTVAQCRNNDKCTDQCNLTETTCDATGKFVKHCVYGNIYDVTYVGNVSPMSQYCNHWDNYLNWTPCKSQEKCSAATGTCVPETNADCVPGESICINIQGNSISSFLSKQVLNNLDAYGTDINNVGFLRKCSYNSQYGNYTWENLNNVTVCYWGCNETVKGNLHVASCSDAQQLWVQAKSSLNEIRGGLWVLTGQTDEGRIMFVAIVTIILMSLMTVFVGWQLGVLSAIATIVSAALLSWFGLFSLPILAIFLIGLMYLVYKAWKD